MKSSPVFAKSMDASTSPAEAGEARVANCLEVWQLAWEDKKGDRGASAAASGAAALDRVDRWLLVFEDLLKAISR
jgi:hypothetical protein